MSFWHSAFLLSHREIMSNQQFYIDAWYTSIEQVKMAIKQNDKSVICRTMPAIGMESEFNKEVEELISMCIKNKEPWIRRAGYMCIYHMYVRMKDSIFTKNILDIIKFGMIDKEEPVKDIIGIIMDEIKEFSPDIFKQLYKKANDT